MTDLERIGADLRSEEVSLEETVSRVTAAVGLFRAFKRAYASRSFDVRSLSADTGGKREERAFDWKSLAESRERTGGQ